MKILVHHDGQQLGPFSRDEVRAAVVAGTVRESDLAWEEGMPSWVPLNSLLGAPEAAPAAPPSPPVPPRPVSTTQFPAPPQTSGMAIASLIFGIISLIGCAPLGIVAVICGHSARRAISETGGRMEGDGLAVAGLITGYIGVLLTLVVVVVLVLFLAGAVAIPVLAH